MAVLESGHSCLALGEPGVTDGLDDAIAQAWPRQQATAIYKGSGKKFFVELADQLGIDTTEPKYNKDGDEVGERNLTMDELKAAIAHEIDPSCLLIFPEAKRLTTGVRYWLEDVIAKGVRVCAIAVDVPRRDVFLEMIEIDLELPSDRAIREVMREEAQRLGMAIADTRLSELQSQAGRNPMLARKAIRNEKLGLNPDPQHSQYLDISPIIISAIMALSVVRFIGMGTGDKGLYIVGGIALIVGMMLKQLGSIKGARKRVGQ
jgi:hypothetical protein